MTRRRTVGPLKAIRRYCLWCCIDQPREVELCPSGAVRPECPLFPHRFGSKPSPRSLEGWTGGPALRPLKAIKAQCKDCHPEGAWSRTCRVEDCHLYPFRKGTNPNFKQPRGRPFQPRNDASATPQPCLVREQVSLDTQNRHTRL
jgi:hypothetical protein